jgi:hypothetical protein
VLCVARRLERGKEGKRGGSGEPTIAMQNMKQKKKSRGAQARFKTRSDLKYSQSFNVAKEKCLKFVPSLTIWKQNEIVYHCVYFFYF